MPEPKDRSRRREVGKVSEGSIWWIRSPVCWPLSILALWFCADLETAVQSFLCLETFTTTSGVVDASPVFPFLGL